MKKKFILGVIIGGLAILIFGKGILIPDNEIDQVIKKALRIQYGWESLEELNQLCTKEFLETVDSDEICLGRKIYSIEKGYMDTVREISEKEIEISVNVYSPDITIHKFTLMKTEDDTYLISGIENDI